MLSILEDYRREKMISESCGEKLTPIGYVWYSLRNWYVSERCKRYGHDYTSYIVSEECGSETLICKKCGDMWEIPMF